MGLSLWMLFVMNICISGSSQTRWLDLLVNAEQSIRSEAKNHGGNFRDLQLMHPELSQGELEAKGVER